MAEFTRYYSPVYEYGYYGVSDPNELTREILANNLGFNNNLRQKPYSSALYDDLAENIINTQAGVNQNISMFDMSKYLIPNPGSYADAWKRGGLGGLWERFTASKSGTIFNPGRSDFENFLGGISFLAGLYGAYKQQQYMDKMSKLYERAQRVYEQQLAEQERRRQQAQANYNRSQGL